MKKRANIYGGRRAIYGVLSFVLIVCLLIVAGISRYYRATERDENVVRASSPIVPVVVPVAVPQAVVSQTNQQAALPAVVSSSVSGEGVKGYEYFSPPMLDLVKAIESGRALEFKIGGEKRTLLLRERKALTDSFQVGLGADYANNMPSSIRVFSGITSSTRLPVVSPDDYGTHEGGGEHDDDIAVLRPSFSAEVSLAVVNGSIAASITDPDGSYTEVWSDPVTREIKAAQWEASEFGYTSSIGVDEDGREIDVTHSTRQPDESERDRRAISASILAIGEDEGGFEISAVNSASDLDPSTGSASKTLDILPRGSLYEASLKEVPMLWVANKNRTGVKTAANLEYRASRFLAHFGRLAMVYEYQIGFRVALQELIMIPSDDSITPDFGASGTGGSKLVSFYYWLSTYRNQGTYSWHGAVGFPNYLHAGMAWVGSFPWNHSVSVCDDWHYVVTCHEFGHNCGARHTAGGIMNAYVSNSRDFYTWDDSVTAAQQIYSRCNSRGYNTSILRNPTQVPWALDDKYTIALNTPITFNPTTNDLTKTVCGSTDNVLRIVELSRIYPADAGTAEFMTNSVTFTPATNYEGVVWISYTIQGNIGNNGNGWLHQGHISITVGSDTRQGLSVTVPAGKTVEFVPSVNGSITTQPAQAHVAKDMRYNVLFIRANASASGSDSFQYAGQTVTINYVAAEPLIAVDDYISYNQPSGALRIAPLANDHGMGNRQAPDNVDVVFVGSSITEADSHDQGYFRDTFELVSVENLSTELGSVSVQQDWYLDSSVKVLHNTGWFTFTPASGASGVARVGYTVRDVLGNSDEGIVYIILPLLDVDVPMDQAPTVVLIHENSKLVVEWDHNISTNHPLNGVVSGRCESYMSPTGAATVISQATSNEAVAAFSAPGSYTLRMVGADNGYETYRLVRVAVYAATNLPSSGNLGGYAIYTNGTVAVSSAAYDLGDMDMTVVDDAMSGLAFTTTWSWLSGPREALFSDASSPTTTVTFAQSGAYVLRLFMDDGKLITCQDFDFNVTISDSGTLSPWILTLDPTGVGATGATLRGDLVSKGSSNPDVTIYYGTVAGGIIATNWAASVDLGTQTATGVVNQSVSSLIENTTYYARGFATNSYGGHWATSTVSFVTGKQSPEIDNDRGAALIGHDYATLYGNLISTGSAPVSVTLYYGNEDAGSVAGDWDHSASLGSRSPGLLSNLVSSLSSSTEYMYRYFAANSYGSDWSDRTDSFLTLGTVPVVNNGDGIQDISYFTVDLQGWLVSTGTSETVVSVYYGANDGGTTSTTNWDDSFSAGVQSVGAVPVSITGLTQNVSYQYRFFASNGSGTAWSPDAREFTTLGGRPVISSDSAEDIGYTNATLCGTLITTGAAPTTVTLYYGTANAGTVSSNWQFSVNLSTQVVGSVSNVVQGLSDATTYYYRFYATNIYEEYWSASVKSFGTLDAAPYIENYETTSIDTNSATMRGYLSSTGSAETVVWLYYGTSNGVTNVTWWESSVLVGTQQVGDVSSFTTGLSEDTTYYYRFWASNVWYSNWASDTECFETLELINSNDFTHSLQVDLDGYVSAETLTNFPALLALSTNISGFSYYGFVSSPWYDLRVADTNGVELVYEVETWNTNGESAVWVRVPELKAFNTTVHLYWGRSGDTEPQPYTANGSVWRDDYDLVWHLGSSDGTDAIDSSRHGRDGAVNTPEVPDWVSGAAGNSLDQDGVYEYVSYAHSEPETEVANSMWIKTTVPDNSFFTVSASERGTTHDRNMAIDTNGQIVARLSDTATLTSTGLAMTNDQWHYIVHEFGDSIGGQKLYIDGVEVDSGSKTNAEVNTDTYIQAGWGAWPQSTYFDGGIDEVRVSRSTRSDNWIWAVYNNIAFNSTFCSFDDVARPAMRILGTNGIAIAHNDLTPSTASGTDLGTFAEGDAFVYQTFTITNVGAVATELTGTPLVDISQDYGTSWSVVTNPALTTIDGGAATTFTLRYNPANSGVHDAVVRIYSTDFNLVPFTFGVTATTLIDTDSFEYALRIDFSGYDRDEILYDFPVLVQLNEELSRFDYSTFELANGGDLRFRHDDDTPLVHEIDSWNSNGTSEVWVRIPEFSSNTVIWAHWDNSNLTSGADFSTNGATWNSQYKGVWHLGNISGASSVLDSSAGLNDGTNVTTAAATGIVGGARDFEGADSIVIPSAALSGLSDQISVSLWQYGDAAVQPQDDLVFEGGNISTQRVVGAYLPSSSGIVYWDAGNVGGNYDRISKLASASEYEGQWNQWVFVKDVNDGDESMRIYLNGALWHNSDGVRAMETMSMFRIGSDISGARNYDGMIDEFRISNVDRSLNWIWATYINIASNDTFVVYDMVRGGPHEVLVDQSTLFIAEDQTATFDVYISWETNVAVTVNSAYYSGDTDISVVGGASLSFATNTWKQRQSVTVQAADDIDWMNSTGVVRSTSTGALPVDVTVTENDRDEFEIPFTETFEPTDVFMAATLGTLDGQRGWEIDPVLLAVVENTNVAVGAQSARLGIGSLVHDFDGGHSNSWVSFFTIPSFGEAPSDPDSGGAASFTVDSTGTFYAQSNLTWLSNSDVIFESNQWVKLTVHCDYETRLWSVWRNTTPLFLDIPFISGSQSAFEGFDIDSIDSAIFLDHVIIDTNYFGLGIGVLGSNDTEIVDGDTTPREADSSDFGVLSPLGFVEKTFTITNSNLSTLNLTGSPRVELSGPNADLWSVETQPAATVAAGATSTFTLRYSPLEPGLDYATVSFTNSVDPQSPYTFDIKGAAWDGLFYWDGDGAPTNLWTLGTNWLYDLAPDSGTGTLVQFAGTVGLQNTNDFADGFGMGMLSFSNNAGAFILEGNRIAVYQSISNESVNAQTVQHDVELGATIDIYGVGDLEFGGVVSGVGFDKLGTNQITLTGENTFTGEVTVASGIVQINQSLGLGTASQVVLGTSVTGSDDIRLVTGQASGDLMLTRPILVSSNGTGTVVIGGEHSGGRTFYDGLLTIERDVTLWGEGADRTHFRGGITGTGNVVIADGNRVIWSTTTTEINMGNGSSPYDFDGNIIITNALLQIDSDFASGSASQASKMMWVATNASFSSAGGADITLDRLTGGGLFGACAAGGLTAPAIMTIGASGGTSIYEGRFYSADGSGIRLVKDGAGTFTLAGEEDNSSLAAVVDAGTLVLAKQSSGSVHAVGGSSTGLTINDGAIAQISGSGEDQIYTLDDVIVNAGGTLDMNGINEGFDGLSGSGKVTSTSNSTCRLTVGEGNGTTTFSGLIENGSGTLGLTKTGSGTLTLTGTNTYSDLTIIRNSGGILNLANSNVASIQGDIQLGHNLNGGGAAYLYFEEDDQLGSNVTISNMNSFSGDWGWMKLFGTRQTVAGLSCLNAGMVIDHVYQENGYDTDSTLVINPTGNFFYNGMMRDNSGGTSTGRFSVVKTGSGTQSLAGGNGTVSFSGGIIISNGVLSVHNSYAAGSGSITFAGGMLGLDGGGLNADDLAGLVTSGTVVPRQTELTPWFATTDEDFAVSTTWAYQGYIVNTSTVPVTWSFAENIDDNCYLVIDGQTILSDTSHDTPTYGTVTLLPGIHSFDLRLYNGSSAGGPGADGWWDDASIGFGIDFQGRDEGVRSNYEKLCDTGDGSLLCVQVTVTNDIDLTQDSTVRVANAYSPTNLLSGVISGVGGLTKIGDGLLEVSGSNTYTGTTIVDGGVLFVDGTHIGGGAYTVSDGAMLAGEGSLDSAVTVQGGAEIGNRGWDTNRTLTVGSLTMNNGSSFACMLDGTNATIEVSGALSISSTTTVDVYCVDGAMATGTYALVSYGSYGGGTAPLTLADPLPNGALGYLIDNTTDKLIELCITNVGSGMVWNGQINSDWDVDTTANWKLGNSATDFSQLDQARFDDTAVNFTVDIKEAVHPESVLITNNLHDYAFAASSYGISGTTSLTKSGTGTVSIANANTYSGLTTIQQGIIEITGSDDRLPVGGTVKFSGGTLHLDGVNQTLASVTVDDNETGYATGSNTLTLSGADIKIGGIGGNSTQTLDLRSLATFEISSSASKMTVGAQASQGGTEHAYVYLADMSTLTLDSLEVGGADQSGYSDDQSQNQTYLYLGQTNIINADNILVGTRGGTHSHLVFRSGLTDPELTIRGTAGGSSRANITIGENWDVYTAGSSEFDLDIGVSGTSTLDAMVGTLEVAKQYIGNSLSSEFVMENGTLDATTIYISHVYGGTHNNVGTGTFYLNGGTVKAGTLQFTWDTGTGQSDGKFYLNSGTLKVATYTQGNGRYERFYWNGGTIANYDASTDFTIPTLSSFSISDGAKAFDISAGLQGTVNAVMSGTGGFDKDGTGTLTLTAVNTFSGDVAINAGTLELGSGGSISSSATITVGTNGLLDVSEVSGGFEVASGQTLEGYGMVTGNVTTVSGATIQAGEHGTAGTLIFTNSLTLVSGSTNRFDLGTDTTEGSGSNDLIHVEGDLDLGDAMLVISELSVMDTNTYTLYTYSGTLTGGFNSVISCPVHASVDTTSQPGKVLLHCVPETDIVWATSSDVDWNFVDANWELISDSSQTLFFNRDNVLFDDTVGVITDVTIASGITVEPHTITVDSDTNDFSFVGAGIIAGDPMLTKTGTSTFVIANSVTNSFTNGIRVQAGTVQIGAGGTIGMVVGDITNDAAVVFSRSDDILFTNVVSGSGSVSQSGSGTLTFINNQPYLGDTTIAAGTLQLGNGGTSGMVEGNIVDNGTLVFNRSDDFTCSNVISGSGTVVKQAGNAITLDGVNTYSGNTTISGGTLEIGGAGQLGGGTYAGAILNSGSLIYDSTADQTFSGVISSTGSVTKGTAQTGSLVTYAAYLPTTAVVIFPNATLSDYVDAHGTVGGGWVNNKKPVPAKAYFFSNNGTTATYQLQAIDATTTKCLKVELTQVGADIKACVLYSKYITSVNLGFDFDTGGTDGTIATSASASGYGAAETVLTTFSYSKAALTLSTANSYSGGTVVNNGILKASTSASALPSSGDITVENGGELWLDVPSLSASGSGGVGNGNPITVNTGGALVLANAFNSGYSRLITLDGGRLNTTYIDGSSIPSLNYVNNLTLKNGAMVTGYGIWVGYHSAATFNVSGTNASSMSGNIKLVNDANASALTMNVADTTSNSDADLTVSGTIADYTGLAGLPIIKTGAGTLTLAGANTYIGDTIISNGVLELSASGSIGSSAKIEVCSNTTFDVSAVSGFALGGSQIIEGYGSINGAVTTTSGTKIYPGENGTAGTLTFNGNLTEVAGTTNYFDLASTTDEGGGTNDLIVVNGNLDASGASLVITAIDSLTNSTYTLFTYTGSISGSFNPVISSPIHVSVDTTSQPGKVLLHCVPDADIVWATSSNVDWNFMDANWKLVSDSSQTSFFNNDSVLFDDTVGVITNVTIPSGITVEPYAITVDSDTNDFSFVGAGIIAGDPMLTKTGTSTFVIANSVTNSFTNGIRVQEGRLQIGAGGTIGMVVGDITNDAAVVFSRSDDILFTNLVSGSGSVSQSGSGALTFINNQPYLGDTTIGSGTLQLGNGGTSGMVEGNIVDNGTLIFNRSDDFTCGNVISGSGTVVKQVGNAITLNGVNTYSGNTTISGGTLEIGGVGQLGGGTYAGAILNSGSLIYDSTADQTLSGIISSTGSVTKGATQTGSQISYSSYLPTTATVIFPNATLSDYVGAHGTMNGGHIGVALPKLTAKAYHFVNDGTTATYQLQAYESPHTKCVKIELTQVGADIKARAVYAKYLANTKDLGFDFDGGGGNGTVATSATANGYGAAETILTTYTSYHNAMLTLSAVNTYTGGSVVNNGIVRAITTASALPSSGGITVNTGGELWLNVSSGMAYDNSGGVGNGNSITVNTGGTLVLVDNFNTGYSRLITLDGGRLSSTAGDSSDNVNYMNNLTMKNGAQVTGNRIRMGNFSAGTITVSGTSASSLAAGIRLVNTGNAPVLTMNVADATSNSDADLTISGTIIDYPSYTGLPIIKTGAGTLLLSGANTYVGDTIISNGVLELSAAGSIGSSAKIEVCSNTTFDVSAVSGFTLGGSQIIEGYGSINGAVTTGNGTLIYPGENGTAGTLTFNGNLTEVAGTINYFDLAATTDEGGGTNDLIVVNGNLDVGGASLVITAIDSLTNDTYTLFTYTGSLSGTFDPDLSCPVHAYLDTTSTVGKVLLRCASGEGLRWTGDVDQNWNFSTANWEDVDTLTSRWFFDEDEVLFDDTATSFTVDVVEVVSPGSIVVSNVLHDYLFADSSGEITGTASLTKRGAGTLTIANANTYSGNTTVREGTLALTTGNNRLSTSATVALAEAGLLYIDGVTQTVANIDIISPEVSYGTYVGVGVISGSNGAVLNLPASFEFGVGGSVTMTETLRLNNLNTTGSSLIIGKNNSTNWRPGIGYLHVNGGTLTANEIALARSISGSAHNPPSTGKLTISNAVVKVSTFKLGQTPDSGTTVRGTIELNYGGDIYAETIGWGSGYGQDDNRFNWYNGTVHNYDASTDLTINQISDDAVSFILYGSDLHELDIDSGRAGTVNQIISGSGALTKSGDGTLTLTKANTYTGDTLISNGVFKLSASGSISSSATITLGTNVTFDVSEVTGGFEVASGQTLEGYGVVTGSVAMAAGSILQAGEYGTAGTLIFTNSLTLVSGTTNHFDLGSSLLEGSGSNDLINVAGDLDLGGASLIINELTSLTNGSYTLYLYTGSLTGTLVPVFDSLSPGVYSVDTSSVPGKVLLHCTLNVLNEYAYDRALKITTFGYDKSETLTNFPMLVRLSEDIPYFDYADFYSPTGGDLRFTDSDGETYLPYEVEEWNTNGISSVWVQVPEMLGTNDHIWAYWSNPHETTAPDYTTNGATWNEGFGGVWHKNQTSGNAVDSTSYGNDGTMSGNIQQNSTGMIAGCDEYDGSGDYYSLSSATELMGIDGFTVSAWIKGDNVSDVSTIYSTRNGGSQGFSVWLNNYDANDRKITLVNRQDGGDVSTVNGVWTVGNWHHVAVVHDEVGAAQYIYVDGVEVASASKSWAFNATSYARIGDEATHNNYAYDGLLDELRVSSVTRSSNWVWAVWLNTATNSTFIDYGEVWQRGSVFVVDGEAAGGVALPFVDAFEAHPIATIDGVNNWSATTPASSLVQGNSVYGGAQAVGIYSNVLHHTFSDATATNVWIDWHTFPVRRTTEPFQVTELAVTNSAAFYLHEDGYVVALSNATWVSYPAVTVPTEQWVRFSANLNYQNKVWSLYMADSTTNEIATVVATNLAFSATDRTSLRSFRVSEDSAWHTNYLDNVGVRKEIPLSIDSDGDGMPDGWEDNYGLDSTNAANPYGANDDLDGDGIINILEFVAGTDPDDANSYMSIISMDIDGETSDDIRVTFEGGGYNEPSSYSTTADNNGRIFSLITASGSVTNSKVVVINGGDDDSKTYVWTNASAVAEATSRYFVIGVEHAGLSYTNSEEWAMHVQPRSVSNSYLVCVPVDLPAGSNNLNSTLGTQLARGLHADSTSANADKLRWINGSGSYVEYYISDAGWREVAGDGLADIEISTGKAMWVVRGSDSANRNNSVFVGKSFTSSTVTNTTFSKDIASGWTMFGWPLPQSRKYVSSNTSSNQLGFATVGTGGNTWDRSSANFGDEIWVQSGNGWDWFWLTDSHDGADVANGRWWTGGGTGWADIELEVGKGYYYRHTTNWSSANFDWTPEVP